MWHPNTPGPAKINIHSPLLNLAKKPYTNQKTRGGPPPNYKCLFIKRGSSVGRYIINISDSPNVINGDMHHGSYDLHSKKLNPCIASIHANEIVLKWMIHMPRVIFPSWSHVYLKNAPGKKSIIFKKLSNNVIVYIKQSPTRVLDA